MDKLFAYWMKHFAAFRKAHASIYANLHGAALRKYWTAHWATWIKNNMRRVTGGSGTSPGASPGSHRGVRPGQPIAHPTAKRLDELFAYWMKHFAAFRRAHPSIYAHLSGAALRKYWEAHWATWIRNNLWRVP